MNTQAVSNNDIATFLQKSSAAMAEANNSLEETIALGTAATEITRDASNTGNVLKTMAMRIRGYDEETNMLSADLQELSGEIANVTKTAEHPMGISLFTDETKNTYKSTYQILKEISEIYDELSDKQQANLLELLGGKRNGQAVAAILNNFETVEKSLKTMSNSAGNAMKEMGIIQDSLTYKINKLKETGTGIFQNIFNKSELSSTIDVLTGILQFVEKITNGLGLLGTTISGIGIAVLIKNFSKIKEFAIEAATIDNVNAMFKAYQAGTMTVEGVTAAMAGLSAEKQIQVVVDSALSASEKELMLQELGLTEAEISQALATQGVAAAETTATATTVSLSAAFKALFTTLLHNPFVLAAAAIITLIGVLNKLSKARQKAYEAAQEETEKAQEKSQKIKQESETIEELIEKYKELKESENSDSPETRAQILDIQNQIVGAVGEQAYQLDLVNGKLDEEIAKLETIKNQKMEELLMSYKGEYVAAADEGNKFNYNEGNAMYSLRHESANSVAFDTSDVREQSRANIIVDEALRNANMGNAGLRNVSADDFSVIHFYSENLKDKLAAVDVALKALENNKDFDAMNSEYYHELSTIRAQMYATVQKQEQAANSYLSALTQQQAQIGNSEVNSLETYRKYRKEIIENIQNDSVIQDAISNGFFDESYLDTYVDGYLSTLSSMSTYYKQWQNAQTAWTQEEATRRAEEAKGAALAVFANTPKMSFADLLNLEDENEDTFKDRIEKYKDNVEELKEALQKYRKGELSGADMTDLQLKFPELIGHTEDFDEAVKQLLEDTNNDMMSQFISQFNKLDTSEDREQLKALMDSVLELGELDSEDLLGLFDKLDSDLQDIVDNYINNMNKLEEAAVAFSHGDLVPEDLKELYELFPELMYESGDLGVAIDRLKGKLNSNMLAKFEAQFGKLDNAKDIEALEKYRNAVLKVGSTVGKTTFEIDIETEISGVQDLLTAMKESVTSTGLTKQSIENLKERYDKLFESNPAEKQKLLKELFEKTENGIHLNTEALRKLEHEYEKYTKGEIDKELSNLIKQYEDLSKQIDNASSAAEGAQLYAKRQDILTQIENISTLAAEYEGLTSAFHKWEEAQSIGEEGDMYDSLAKGLENIKQLYDDGLVGTNKFRTAVQLMSNQDLSTANIEQLISAYEKGYDKMTRYFTEGSEGCTNFLQDVQALNKEWAHMNQDGSWEINFGVGNDQEIADKLGINVEAIQSILRKLSDYGFDINLDSIYSKLDLAKTKAEEATEKLKAMGITDFVVNFDSTSVLYLDEQIEKTKEALKEFTNTKGEVDLSLPGAEQVQQILEGLILQRQSLEIPVIMEVKTDNADSDVEKLVQKLKNFWGAYSQLQMSVQTNADTTQAQQQVDNWKAEIGKSDVELLAKLGIDTTSLETLNTSIKNITEEMLVNVGVDLSEVKKFEEKDKNEEATVTYKVDSKEVEKFQNKNKNEQWTVTYGVNQNEVNNFMNKNLDRYATLTYNVVTNGSPKVEGTAHVYGTAHARGTAFKSGDWGAKDSGIALMGELGREKLRLYIAICI